MIRAHDADIVLYSELRAASERDHVRIKKAPDCCCRLTFSHIKYVLLAVTLRQALA